MSEKTTNEKVNEIYDAVIGSGLHKGDGILDRLARLETWRGQQGKVVGIIAGAAAVLGFFASVILKMF